jgi:DNA-binding transcriptional LysR family regulator
LTTDSRHLTDPAEPTEPLSPAEQILRDIHTATTMDLNILRAFVHLADVGSPAAVARAIGWTRATLTHRMALLEDRLGGRLLTTGPEGTCLTTRGARFLPYVRVLLCTVEALRNPLTPGPGPGTDQ